MIGNSRVRQPLAESGPWKTGALRPINTRKRTPLQVPGNVPYRPAPDLARVLDSAPDRVESDTKKKNRVT